MYAGDAADGFDTILHKGVEGEAYNIESGNGVVNLEVAVRMLELFGYDPQADFATRLSWIADRPFNDHDYHVDGSKLARLGWKQKMQFETGLEITVDWYRKHLDTWWTNETLDSISMETPAVATENMKDPMAIEGSRMPIALG